MSSVREESAATKTDDGDVAVLGQALEDAIPELVALAVDVLRALSGTGPTRIEVSGAATEVKIDVALRAARELRALRNVLQDYVDRTQLVPATDASAIRATAALRDLLELIFDKPLPPPGERAKPVDQSGLDDALKAAAAAAVALQQAAEPAGTQPEDSEPTWTVRNLTPQPLELQGRDAVWVLPAYGRRTLNRSPRLELDLRSEEALGRVQVTEEPPPTPVDYSPLGLWLLLVPVAIGFGSQQGKWGGWIGGAIAIALPLAWIFAVRVKRKERLRDVLAGLAAWGLQAVTFLIVLTFCLAVPAATLYYGANLEPVVSDVLDGNATSTDYLTVVCRTMQLVLISVAALLPALLYYQFDRDRLSTLRQRFEHQIFRLDPKMETIRDIDATYGRQINEIYGPERSGRSSKLPPGRRAPIFVATVLIMLGWLLVLLNPDVDVVNDEAEIAELFAPRQTAAAFAFLGAYFFTLFALLRGYVRRDLRPKSYSDISVRIVTVVILAWVLELMFVDDSSRLLVFAFIVGIVPQAALNWLREMSQGLVPQRRPKLADGAQGSDAASGAEGRRDDALAAALADPLPLTDLQGIDLYDRTRLASEGVTNIEALAHHDLVELMLLTRIPVPRLIDWTDQAILHLHVIEDDRAKLRRYGIRTASDLVHAAESATNKDEFLTILDGAAGKPKRLEVIVEAIKDEAWMDNIRFWHGDHDPDEKRAENSTERSQSSTRKTG